MSFCLQSPNIRVLQLYDPIIFIPETFRFFVNPSDSVVGQSDNTKWHDFLTKFEKYVKYSWNHIIIIFSFFTRRKFDFLSCLNSHYLSFVYFFIFKFCCSSKTQIVNNFLLRTRRRLLGWFLKVIVFDRFAAYISFFSDLWFSIVYLVSLYGINLIYN